MKRIFWILLVISCFRAQAAHDEAEKKFSQALKATDASQLDKAQGLYDELLKTEGPISEYMHFEDGLLLAKKNDFKGAQEQFEKTLSYDLNPLFKQKVTYQLAIAEIENNKFKDAQKDLVKLEKKKRGDKDYGDVIYELAMSEKKLGDKKAFCKWATKLYVNYASYKEVSDWGIDLAKNKFQGEPTNCSVTFSEQKKRIKNLQSYGLNEKSMAEIQALKAKNSSFEIDELMAQFYAKSDEYAQALEVLLKYYDARKNNFDYLVEIASIAAKTPDWVAAAEWYYDAYKINKKASIRTRALYMSAFINYQYEDYDGATRKFEELLKIDKKSKLSADTHWYLSWIAYLKGNFQDCFDQLTQMEKIQRGSLDKVRYWQAMCQTKLGNYAEAETRFQQLTQDPLMSYYGLAAKYRLLEVEAKKKKSARYKLDQKRMVASLDATMIPGSPDSSEETEQSLEIKSADETTTPGVANEEAKEEAKEDDGTEELDNVTFADFDKKIDKIKRLQEVGLKEFSVLEMVSLEKQKLTKDQVLKLVSFYEKNNMYHRSAKLSYNYFTETREGEKTQVANKNLWQVTYPQAYADTVKKYSSKLVVPQELIWSIMRAESRYKKDAVSPVGALGLMQVMPNTGHRVSELMKEKTFDPATLTEPDIGIKIGTKYLQRLMKMFDGNPALVAAAYNAGPHKVKYWISTFGYLDLDEFIEHIPYVETRNYVKQVVSNFEIYSTLYSSQKNKLDSLTKTIPVKVPESEAKLAKETWEDI